MRKALRLRMRVRERGKESMSIEETKILRGIKVNSEKCKKEANKRILDG